MMMMMMREMGQQYIYMFKTISLNLSLFLLKFNLRLVNILLVSD